MLKYNNLSKYSKCYHIIRYISIYDVFNQSTLFKNIHLYQSDQALIDAMKTFHGINLNDLDEYGKTSGSEDIMISADTAEKNKPVLAQFDNYGRRIDVVNYHDCYHKLMKHGIEHGILLYQYIVLYISLHQ